MFPYVVQHVDTYVAKMSVKNVKAFYTALKADINDIKDDQVKRDCMDALGPTATGEKAKVGVVACVKKMVEYDVKATGLKKLQGDMWDSGFKSGELKGHVFPDFVPVLKWCQSNEISVNIYSSGSVKAQKLLFGHSIEGDLTKFLTDYFDTANAGNKKEASSYKKIAEALGVHPREITFVSDAEAELVAAREAGIRHVVMSVRPGNACLTDVGREFSIVHSLLQLCGV